MRNKTIRANRKIDHGNRPAGAPNFSIIKQTLK